MIDAEVGGVAANSYVTLAEAERYFADRLDAGPWGAASATDKEKALLTAARALGRVRWQGAAWSREQGLSWPRTGVAGVVDGALPRVVRDAQCEEALALLTPALTRRRVLQAAGVTVAQVDGAREGYRPALTDALLSAEARQMLCGLVAQGARLVTDAAQEG